MSSTDYQRETEEAKKLMGMIKKDLRYRQDQVDQGQTTYSIDAEIRMSLSELPYQQDELVSKLEKALAIFKSNPKDFGLTNKEVDKRSHDFASINNEAKSLKRQYDASFEKKTKVVASEDKPRPDYSNFTRAQLAEHGRKQEEEEEQAIDQLIGVAKNLKTGGKEISNELNEQEGMLNELDRGMDSNIKGISKTRKNMMKLLDKSSNCCLIAVVVIELAAIAALLIF